MRQVFKYPLSIEDEFTLQLPIGAELLAVQVQIVRGTETPTLWALVDDSAPSELRTFLLRGTGHPIDASKNIQYVGTFQLGGGAFVGHLFEETVERSLHPFGVIDRRSTGALGGLPSAPASARSSAGALPEASVALGRQPWSKPRELP